MSEGNAPIKLGELQKEEGIKLQTGNLTAGDQVKERIVKDELVKPIVPEAPLSPDEEIARTVRESKESDKASVGGPTITVENVEPISPRPETQIQETGTINPQVAEQTERSTGSVTEKDIPSWIRGRIEQLARAVSQNVPQPTSPSPRHEIFGIKTPRRAADKGGDEAIVETPVKETHLRINNMDDEYYTTPAVKIDILSPVILDQLPISARESLVEDFKYLSSTRRLETGTPRLKVIQDYVERMVKGNQQWEGNVRVVIMNKGKEPRAFASPDGTIFVTQSLINILDSTDEVMAIIAHEVGHLTNGTTLAKYRSEKLRGSSLGVGWLHEMASDFGGSDLLEKVGLNSVAPKDLFIKLRDYYGGIRDKEHQDLTIRAIEIYGKHYVQDSKTSHLPYIPLVSELKQDFIMTNFEAVRDAATKGDIESVELYLDKLHPKDFGEFYHIADKGQINTEWDKRIEVANKVRVLVTQRLLSEGYTDKEIKLFFDSNTEILLRSKYKNIVEVQDYLVLSEELYQKDFFNPASLKMFDEENHGDTLLLLVYRVSGDEYGQMFLDENTRSLIGIEHIAKFIETVNTLTKGKLRRVRDGDFINENGLPVKEWSSYFNGQMNREERMHQRLKDLMFKYLAKAYLSDPNILLDANEIENYFQKIKDTGFETLTQYEHEKFPIEEKICNQTNRQIIESAHRTIFGIEIVKPEVNKKLVDFFTPEEYREKIKGSGKYLDIDSLNHLVRDYDLDEEATAKYVQVGLEHLSQVSFFDECLREVIFLEIGPDKWNAEYYAGIKLDSLITKFGLDQTAIYEKTRKKEEFYRTFYQFNYVVQTMVFSAEKIKDLREKNGNLDSQSVYDLTRKRITAWDGKFLGFVESIMHDAKVDIKALDQFELVSLCLPLIKLADNPINPIGASYGIEDMDRFYKLPFIQELIKKVENVHFDNLQDLRKYIEETDQKYNHIFSPGTQNFIPIYEDDVSSIILYKQIRDEIQKLTDSLQRRDYPDMIKLLNERFPSSPQKRELIRTMEIDYINDKSIDIHDKIKFYFEEYKLLGIEGASLVAEQITDIPTWQIFYEQYHALKKDYLSGQESVEAVALTDYATSMLTKQADHLIKTVSTSPEASREVSTEWAINWIHTYMTLRDGYDRKTGKFVLGGPARHGFISFADAISAFKDLPKDKKFVIALKALEDQDGLLKSEGGRNLLEKMVIEGLDLKDEFFSQILVGIIKSKEPVVSIPIAQMLTPLMFRGLDTNAVDMAMVGQARGSDYKDIKYQDYFQDLPRILGSGTREIRDFGFRYRQQPNSGLMQLAKESSLIYLDTLDKIKKRVTPLSRDDETSEKDKPVESHLTPSTEAMIRAGETSALFIRGMQMAVQIKEFEPAVRERLLKTQDSTKGMDKLRFWDNLLKKADLNEPGADVQLERILREDLISLDKYLGGGSLFTTYGATIRGVDGSPRAVVIKMLNPNAELFIKEAYELSATTLEGIEQNNTGKVRQDARFARSLIELSDTWCVQDINDPNYIGRDEAFRATVNAFNKERGRVIVNVPKRIYTSVKVKIEDQSTGITLNKFLEDKEVPAERKREAVEDLLALFDFQFEYSPASPQGKRTFYFHSDPHAGNYMIDPESPEIKLDAIDRSMYLSLEQRDVEMFKLMKDGQGVQFVDKFIKRCLEINDIQGNEAQKIYGLTAVKLAREKAKQFLQRRGGKTDNSAFLQIIMQEFTNHGEIKGNKTIEIPLEYRLMIRNIVAMQNLRTGFAS